nr:FUSC family protein [Rhabdothermincola salaria]
MLGLGFVAAEDRDPGDQALLQAAARVSRQVARTLVWPARRRGLPDRVGELLRAADAVGHDPSRRQAAHALATALTESATAAGAPWPLATRAPVDTTVTDPPAGGTVTTAGASVGATLRHELRTGQLFVGHAVRLAVAVGLATLITVSLDVAHAYWLPMTVAWMAKPDLAGTVSRVSLRVVGTLVGVAIAAGVFALTDPGTLGITVLVSVGSLVAFSFIWANYAIAVSGITVIVLSLFASAGEAVERDVVLRLGLTVGAGALTLAVAFVRPRRAGRPLVEALATTAATLGHYAAAVLGRRSDQVTGPESDVEPEVLRARTEVLQARTAADAAIVAAEHEPGRRSLSPGQARRLLDALVDATAAVVAADLASSDPVDATDGRAGGGIGPQAVTSCTDLCERLRRLDAGEDFRPRITTSGATAVEAHLLSAHLVLDELGGVDPVVGRPPSAVRPPS